MRYSACALIFVLFFTPPISLAQESSAMPAIAASAPSATPAFYPVPELMSGFNQLYEQKFDQARVTFSDALTRARALARRRVKTNPKDAEGLFALTLASGMESDADAILEKKQLDGLKRMKEANEYAKQLDRKSV